MVSAMWSRVLRRSGSRTHGKWAVVFLLAGASKSRWFWSSSRLKSGRLSSANFHVRSRTVSHSSKNFSIFPVIRKHLRRRLGAVLFSVLTGCRNQRRGRGSDRQWHGDPGALLQRDFPLMPFFVIPGWLALIMGFLLLGSALLRARGWVTLSGGTAMSRPGKGLRRATTRAHPSTSHPPSPLRDIPAVPRLMPIRADKSAMGAINRPLHCLDARLPITILYT